MEQEEELLRSRFGDIVNVRDVRDIKKKEGDINLRKPILIVSTSQDGPNVSLSSNINMEACDNKVIGEVGGRTGGFCTGCNANEKDMHGERGSKLFHLNMGASQVWDQYDTMLEKLGGLEERVEDVVIPSR